MDKPIKSTAWIGVPFILEDEAHWMKYKKHINARVFGPWLLPDYQPDPREYPCLAIPLLHGHNSGDAIEFEFVERVDVEDMFLPDKGDFMTEKKYYVIKNKANEVVWQGPSLSKEEAYRRFAFEVLNECRMDNTPLWETLGDVDVQEGTPE